MIAKYLLDNGYTQAIFAAECDTGADHYRWKGFQHQMRSAGIDCGEERHILLPEDLSLRRVMYGHCLDCFVQAGAVALASDYDAAEVMNYLQDHGIPVPEQVSVTGFDDCIYAELLHPPLTTVRQNVPAKAEAAVELLVRLIRQEPVECKNYLRSIISLVQGFCFCDNVFQWCGICITCRFRNILSCCLEFYNVILVSKGMNSKDPVTSSVCSFRKLASS